MFENKFKTIWKDFSFRGYYGFLDVNDITEIDTKFKDLDGDGSLEIIREGYRKIEELDKKTREIKETRQEEKIYQILKFKVIE